MRRMHTTRIASLLVPCAALAIGCGGGLQLELVEGAHRTPSNVAVFFTVDTAEGEPVPGLQASDFRIYEDGELVSVDESQQTIINPEVAAEHFTLLLVDMSGSVTESDDVPLITQAAQQFTSSIEAQQRVAVYAFDGSAELHRITPFSRGGGSASAGVGRLGSFRTRDPSTNLHGAVVQAMAEIDRAFNESTTPLKFGTIVVFTDGTDRAGRVSRSDMMDAIGDSDFDVYAVGVGNEIDEGTLSDIGRSGWVRVQDSAAVAQAFEEVSQRILGYMQRFYLLSYCSPARAGVHEVTIEAITPDASGELTYEFDAEGFGPNCNPSTPPPFDTSGRGRPRRRPRQGGEIRASASVSANPEAGLE